jgi:hypothetical protein
MAVGQSRPHAIELSEIWMIVNDSVLAGADVFCQRQRRFKSSQTIPVIMKNEQERVEALMSQKAIQERYTRHVSILDATLIII